MVSPVLWKDAGKVNTTDTASDNHHDPRIIQLTNGNTVIAYRTDATTGVAGTAAGLDIVAKIYDPLGNLVKDEFLLNNSSVTDHESDFELAASPNGGFSVIYEDRAANAFDLRIDNFFADGTHRSGRAIIDDADGNNGGNPVFRNPNITIQSDASILTTYEVYDSVNQKVELRGQLYDAATNQVEGPYYVYSNLVWLGGETLNTHSTTTLSNGKHVLAYLNGNDGNDHVFFHFLQPDGTSIGNGFVDGSFDSATDIHVAGLSNGNFVVTWQGFISGTDSEVLARVYDSGGAPVTPVFTSPVITSGHQSKPAVGALDNGRFVIVYHDDATNDIHAQVYHADGTRDGGEINIVDYAISTFSNPTLLFDIDVQGFDDGRFQVTWSFDPGNDFSIHSRIFDPRSTPNSPNDYTTGQVIGTIGNDTISIAAADQQVYGWFGDDTFAFTPALAINGDIFDGGEGTDTIQVGGVGLLSFRTSTVTSFERIEFASGSSKIVVFNDTQIGSGGLAADAEISGSPAGGQDDLFEVHVTTVNGNFSMAPFNFVNWGVAGDDIRLFGNGGNNTLTGDETFASLMSGGDGNDFLLGGAGNDKYFGEAGADVLFHSLGADAFDGGTGIDYVTYASGAVGAGTNMSINLLNAAANSGLAAGDTFTDVEAFFLSGGNDMFSGDTTNNFIFGQYGGDAIAGAGGGDIIFGEGGNDFINSGALSDLISGGAGADTFYYSINQVEQDQILDFEAGVDKFAFEDTGFNLVHQQIFAGINFFTATSATGAIYGAGQSALIYYTDLGLLYADTDGAGGLAPNLIAALSGTPTLSASDFSVL